MKTYKLSLFSLIALGACTIEQSTLRQEVGTCVSDPLAPGTDNDGDVVPQCQTRQAVEDYTDWAATQIGYDLTYRPAASCSADGCNTRFDIDGNSWVQASCLSAGLCTAWICHTTPDGWYCTIIS